MRISYQLFVCATILCMVMLSHEVMGQNYEGLRYRMTRKAALELLGKFDAQIDREGDNLFTFQNLFTGSGAVISNDILIENALDEQLTLEEYERRRDLYWNFRLIQKSMAIDKLGSLSYTTANTGTIEILVTRQLQWSMKREENFIYRDTIQQIFKINFEQGDSEITCRIASVTNSDQMGYHILLRGAYRNNRKDLPMQNDTLLVSARPYSTDNQGYLIIKRLGANEIITIQTLNPDFHQKKRVSVSEAKESASKSSLVSFRLPKWIVEVNSAFMPVGYRSIQAENYISANKADYLIGINLGRTVVKTAIWEWTAKIGINKSWNEVALSAPTQNYKYGAIDPDGFPYERRVQVEDFIETLKMSFTTLNLGIKSSYKLNKLHSLQAEVGYHHVYNVTATSSRTAEVIYGGYYPDLFSVSIFENGIYDFGRFQITETNTPVVLDISGFVSAQISMSYKLSRTSSIQYGFMYRQSTFGTQSDYSKSRLSSSPTELNSLMQISSRAKVSLVNFTLGYQYKF